MYFFARKRKRLQSLYLKKELSYEDLKNFVYKWNCDNPVDRMYREKHGLKFNSTDHRILNFIDMSIELYEDNMYEELIKENNKKYYTPNIGEFLNFNDDREVVENIDDDDFKNIMSNVDFSKFDDVNNKDE